jgi:lysozyme
MRHVTEDGLRLIRRFEGFSAVPYLCPAGYLTVGYGHVVKNPAAFRQPITEDEATEILVLDIQKAEKAVLRLITVPLSDGQFDALVSFTFNLGSGALQRSTLRRKVNREDHDEVPAEFLRWVWAGGRKLKGLIRRREAEAALYQS